MQLYPQVLYNQELLVANRVIAIEVFHDARHELSKAIEQVDGFLALECCRCMRHVSLEVDCRGRF